MSNKMNVISRGIRSFTIAATLLWSFQLSAQQEWTYTQYQFNLFDVNPAYAGSHQTLSMALRHRSQWLGMDGAPSSDQFSMHTPIGGEQMAAGMRIVSDRIGARRQLVLKGTGVYKVRFRNARLAFGLTGGVIRQCTDAQLLSAQDSDDAVLATLTQAQLAPTLGASIMFTSRKSFWGCDVSNLNRPNWYKGDVSQSRLYRHYSLVGGLIFPIADAHLLEVSGLTKFAEGGQWQSEINVQFLYRNLFWLGSGYRFKSAVQAQAAWMISDHVRVGFSYDYSVGRQLMQPQSSVEGFMGYTLQKRSAHSLRYFLK